MPIELGSLKKLDLPSAPASGESERKLVTVLVKLRDGLGLPSYAELLSHYGPQLISAQLRREHLPRLEADPAVESVAVSHRLDRID
jgi:hypothetical protein